MKHTLHGTATVQDKFIGPATITAKYGVCVATLRRWAEDGKLECRRCPGGKRLYRMADVAQIFGEPEEKEAIPEKPTVCYARVSSDKQRPDLERQIASLQAAYPDAEVLSDIGSGLNWKRTHFLALLERAHSGQLGCVVVAHRDRLCRFAFELVEWILAKSGVRIVVHGEHETARDELADDLLSVVNVFVARHNGLRSAENRRKRKLEEATAKQKGKKNKQKGRKRRRKATETDEGEETSHISDDGPEEDDSEVDRHIPVDL